MLVPHVRKIVGSVDVAPDPLLREGKSRQVPGYETSGHLDLGHHVRGWSDGARSIFADTAMCEFGGSNSANQGSANEISHKYIK
jgi:hypothetical protein